MTNFPHADRLLRDEPLAKYTAARLGGAADYVYIARESARELSDVLQAAWAQNTPVRVLGGGANVLVSDTGWRGLIVINKVSEAAFKESQVVVTSGYALTVLARKCAAQGLAGFEWAASVPGTIGGAVVNNAGAHGGDMASNVHTVTICDAEKGVQVLSKAALGFAYRTSALKARTDRRFLVLMATLDLQRGDPNAISAKIDEFVAYRKRTQPPGASLGSIFKNPPGDYAGRLIESVGLKGYSIGGAQVSPIHANFFINTGAATAGDYYALIQHVREQVARATGVELETEIEILGEF
ncbi:MAG: UDP-N-acetylmuramate dehydrogenase [Anaerolinea sp.]|nr:UDP-N-acetylmuramate dehydrogenase [Anaerolinea sp.]